VEHGLRVGYQGFGCRFQNSSLVAKFADGYDNWFPFSENNLILSENVGYPFNSHVPNLVRFQDI